MRFLIYTCLIGAALLSSCEEVFELNVEIPSEIDIDSRIQAGHTPEVNARVIDGRGQVINYDLLKESHVTIQPEGTGAIDLELSSFSDSSSTFLSEIVIEAGKTYTLTIQSPGLPDVSSVTEVPANVSVRKGSGGTRGPKGGILPDGNFYLLPLVFDDRIQEDNYYHIVVTIRDANSDTEVVDPVTLNFGISPMPSDARRFKETGWLFSDKDFQDNTFDANIRILKEAVLQFPDPVATLELRTVSVDYFNYHIQSSRPKSSNLPNHGQFGTIDNVSGGGGLFGGYSSDKSSYPLEF